MAILAPQSYRMLRRGSIKGCPGGELLTGPEIFVPLAAEYPLARRRLRPSLAHQLCNFFLACACLRIDVVRTIGGGKQRYMGVDENWQHRFAMQVHPLCVPAPYAAHLVVVAHAPCTP